MENAKIKVWVWFTIPLAIAVGNLIANGGEPIWPLWAAGTLSYTLGNYYLTQTQEKTKA